MPHPPTKKQNRIIQIDVTSKCDLACSCCTRGLAWHRKPDMTLEQFEQAVIACKDWVVRENGLLSIFGGNPCVSKLFPRYCEILADHVPEANRGFWTNNLNGHGAVARKYFTRHVYCNVHASAKHAAELSREVPFASIYGDEKPSKHASVFVASRDFVSEEEMWRLVEDCDYDIRWSAMVIQEAPDWQTLGGYSCEIASSHARLAGLSLGVPVVPGWLDLQEKDFHHQYNWACRRCGGCLKLKGIDDSDERDQVSESNKHLVKMTVSRNRRVDVVENLQDIGQAPDPTDYLKRRKIYAPTSATG